MFLNYFKHTFLTLFFFFLWQFEFAFAQKEKKKQDTLNQTDCGDEDFSPFFDKEPNFNPVTFQNPIYIELYNVKNKKLWAPPLANTSLKTSNFGVRWGTFHHGIDLALRTGTAVFAAFDGVVKLSQYYGGYGNCVIISHDNGLETLYGHLSNVCRIVCVSYTHSLYQC